MLYRYAEDNGNRVFYLDKLESFSTDEGGLPYHIIEKTLENILAGIFESNGTYMPIFQERPIQPEPDLVALDEHGNLILFELKRGYIDKKMALDDRLIRYHSVWKNFSYDDLNYRYRKYRKDASADLLDDHKKFFGVDLSKSDFNRAQKLVAVANFVADDLMDYIEPLNKSGDYTVDVMPYRFYKIGEEVFIEFSHKPLDDDFLVRRRFNLLGRIGNSLNEKMNDSFCSSHKISKGYFNADYLRFRKWDGQGRWIANFRHEVFSDESRPLYSRGFSLAVDGKNFYISFHVLHQDSVVPCSEAAKHIPALNDARFKRMSDSKGEEYFRYDLPISSNYPTVDFVEMDDAARSLLDKKNFDAAIDNLMAEIVQFLNLLNQKIVVVSPTSTINIPPPPPKPNSGVIPDTNLTWRLDDDGTLTISGTGKMSGYTNEAPWYVQRESIKKVIVADGITTIGERAFRECKNLTEIAIPDSVTSIGAFAFWGCEKLKEIKIPDGVVFIGNNAFIASGLTKVTIPASVQTIEYFAFGYCYGLESIEILGSLKEIAGGICRSCFSLKNFTVRGTVETIVGGQHGAFQDCRSLTSFTVPPSVNNIDTKIFSGCKNLQTIRYKRGLKGAEKLREGNTANLVAY